MARRFSRTGASRSTRCFERRADDELLHVEVGRVQQAAVLRRGEHGDGVGRAGRAEVGAFERIDGDVDLVELARLCRCPCCARPTFSPMYSIGASSRSPSPMTIVPSIGTVSISRRIASTATWSEPWRSPWPIVWAQAMAACSTTRRNSRERSDSIWPFFTEFCMS